MPSDKLRRLWALEAEAAPSPAIIVLRHDEPAPPSVAPGVVVVRIIPQGGDHEPPARPH